MVYDEIHSGRSGSNVLVNYAWYMPVKGLTHSFVGVSAYASLLMHRMYGAAIFGGLKSCTAMAVPVVVASTPLDTTL